MNKQTNSENTTKYSGWNRHLKSDGLQMLLDRKSEGSLKEFFDDWKWILSYSRQHKGAIVIYTVLGILSATFSLSAAVATKYMIDIIVNRKVDQLWLLVLLMVFSSTFSLLFSSLVSRLSAKITIHVNNEIQADIFAKIMDAEWLKLNAYASGDILNRFSNDIRTVSSNAIHWLPDVLIHLYTFAATFAVICYYDVMMAVIAFLSAPFLLLASRYMMRKLQEHQKKVLEVNSGLMGFEVEAFHNFDTIKSFGIAGQYNEKLKFWQKKYADANLDYNLFTIKGRAYMSVLTMLVSFAAFGYCLFRLWTGTITYGTMMLFLQQRNKLSANFNSLVKIVPNMVNSAVAAHRVRELAELEKEVHDPQQAETLQKAAKDGLTVQLSNVDFSYIENRQVLTGNDLIAGPNEIVALAGHSGEGKTTILRMILGLIHPEAGEAVLLTADGSKVEINADVRGLFSYVPQGNTLMSGTIAENLRLAKEDATEEEMIEALKIACAWEFVEKMEGGLNVTLGERGRGVSEGQAQRIAIARAVLRNAPILLLDEATSALDVETERKVLENMMKQCANKTCIIATHRSSVMNLCQRVYRVMDTQMTELDEAAFGDFPQEF